ncbi:MAG: TolC family protein [Bryobacteraceae bacterium]|nr:TolC family protein [Bryobacteraceae bacterium]
MQIPKLILLLLPGLTLCAQAPLTLSGAVKLALTRHPSLEAASARVEAAGSRIAQARSAWLPRATYTEGFQSGNNPVYVFGALLTEHQFTAGNFNLGPLNRPDALSNFQSQVSVDQTVYDFGATRNAVKAAEIGKKMTEEERRRMELALIAGVARAYHGVALAEQNLQLAEESLKSAQADLDRARSLQRAGVATDADVLSVQVHASAMSEYRARAAADLRIAHAALNEALGLPLDDVHKLTTPMETAALAAKTEGGLEAKAAELRPELLSARLGKDLGAAQESAAKAQYWPVIGLHGVFEADRQNFASKGGANWLFIASARWTLFDGNRNRAAVAEARHMKTAAAASERQMDAAVRLEVRRAEANLDASRERVSTTRDTVAQAEESLRIIRNRYSNGLATVTDLLRSETALLESKTRRLAALYDQRTAAVQLEAATGALNGDSDVLK